MNLKQKNLKQYAPLLFIFGIYTFWLLAQGVNSALSNFISQISIAITMVFGSFIAGGTALGGGAVAFPVMTKLLGIEPATAKVFSLAIQSFGMTAASIAIIFGGIKYYRSILLIALLGALPGVFISLFLIADLFPRLATKSLFSLFLFVFAITLIRSNWQERCRFSFDSTFKNHSLIVFITAFFGGMVSGLIGSGADVAIFALLMLYFKANLKVATATSVLVMAVTSVFASTINYFFLNTIDQQISQYVLAAIPVVIVGAPLGAYFCAKVSKSIMLGLLLVLISLEVVFTTYEVLNIWFD